jgi:hypothetical protein
LARAQHTYSTVVLPVFVFTHCKEYTGTENTGKKFAEVIHRLRGL